MALTVFLKMTSAAGADVFEPVALHAEEGISEPFRFTVDMLSARAVIDPDTLLGKAACVTVRMPSGVERDFHGLVHGFSALGPGRLGRFRFRTEIVPAFWFASQTADCRIFQALTGLQILHTLFSENGVDFDLSAATAGSARDYTVQYNETDYDFAVRLMEEEGYFWFFRHSGSAHTLILSSANTAFANAAQSPMRVVQSGDAPDVLSRFTSRSATAFGKVTLADYDPLHPSTVVEGEQATMLSTTGKDKRDVYRFPALTTSNDMAKSRARLREEAAEARATLCEGAGRNLTLAPGTRFQISNDPLTGADTAYVVRRIVHDVRDDGDMAGAATDSYANTFEAFPAATTWRDWPLDRRPDMSGVHTAVVVGKDGEEIHTDEYGRIKVRFFWDHRKDATADTTIFIRVMQPWSGKNWGWQHLPRVGTEVAVAFVNGDPDSPIVVGCLYNAEQMPVFALPDDQTKSGMRSRSSTRGGTADFNELSFDDKKGSELVCLHAQKDLTGTVENDHSMHVMNDQTLKVDGARTRKVGGGETVTISDSQTLKIGNGRTTTITKGGDALTVDSGDVSVSASSGAMTHEALQGYTIKSTTDGVTISAATSIELSVGGNSIKISQSGITISGTMVKVSGDASVNVSGTMIKLAGDAMVQVQGAMTQVSGNGMLTLKGGLVMIN